MNNSKTSALLLILIGFIIFMIIAGKFIFSIVAILIAFLFISIGLQKLGFPPLLVMIQIGTDVLKRKLFKR